MSMEFDPNAEQHSVPLWRRPFIIGVACLLTVAISIGVIGLVMDSPTPSGSGGPPAGDGTSGSQPVSQATWTSRGPCALLHADEVERIFASPDSDQMLRYRPARRVATNTARSGSLAEDILLDRCEYGTEVAGSIGDFTVTVAARPFDTWRPQENKQAVDGLGERAYVSEWPGRVSLIVQGHGHQLMVQTAIAWASDTESTETAIQASRQRLIAAGRLAWPRLPEKVAIQPESVDEQCRQFDQEAVAEVLGSAVTYARSLSTDRFLRCTFLPSTVGFSAVDIVVDSEPVRNEISDFQREGRLLRVNGVRASWWPGESGLGSTISVVGDARVLHVEHRDLDAPIDGAPRDQDAQPAAAHIGLTGSALDAFDIRPRTGRMLGESCALLSDEDLRRTVSGTYSRPKLIGREVVMSTSGVPADTCLYHNQISLELPALLTVAVSTEPYDPVADHLGEAPERTAIEGLGDSAYSVAYIGYRHVVVHRGSAQLTLSASPSFDSPARDALVSAARAAERRWTHHKLPERAGTGPCTDADTDRLAAAFGRSIAYLRTFSLGPEDRCTFTFADGTLLRVLAVRSGPWHRQQVTQSAKSVDLPGETWRGYDADGRLVVFGEPSSSGSFPRMTITISERNERGLSPVEPGDRHRQAAAILGNVLLDR